MSNTFSNHALICPYCGYEEEVDYETFYSSDLECGEEHTCENCGRDFIATRGVIMVYETFKK